MCKQLDEQHAHFKVWTDSTGSRTNPGLTTVTVSTVEGSHFPFRKPILVVRDTQKTHNGGRTTMKRLSLTAAMMILGAIVTNENYAKEPKVGEPAPAFSLKGSDGKTYQLEDFKNKKAVVVAWYPKAFTGG